MNTDDTKIANAAILTRINTLSARALDSGISQDQRDAALAELLAAARELHSEVYHPCGAEFRRRRRLEILQMQERADPGAGISPPQAGQTDAIADVPGGADGGDPEDVLPVKRRHKSRRPVTPAVERQSHSTARTDPYLAGLLSRQRATTHSLPRV
jgi:hypothetical protein